MGAHLTSRAADKMGGGGAPDYKIPDWRIYKVEDAAPLMETKRALASHGLKDPWIRNEVWRYNVDQFGTHNQRITIAFFRGFKWGLAAAVATVAIEKIFFASDDHHGHGH